MFCGKSLLAGLLVLLISGQVCLGVDKKGINLRECGKTKGCYRNPQGCKNEEECQNVLTWKVHNDTVDFEVSTMLGSDEKWTAVGFSYDKMMGNDSVADCIYDDKNQKFIIQSSYNNNDPSNEVLKNNELGMVKGKATGMFAHQRIMCSFSRYITVRGDPEAAKVFDLNSTYYIFLAKGPVDNGVKVKHTTSPVVVQTMINTTTKMYKDLNNVDVSGCGKTKGCFRSPSNCSGEQNCNYLLTWAVEGNMVNFEITSLLTTERKWTAVGFSDDQMMGNDSVVDCIYNETDQTIIIQSSYNNAEPNNVVLKNNQLGLVPGNSTGTYVDGRISCTFSHYIAAPTSDPEKAQVFNLNSSFYLFLARGPGMKGMKQKHTDGPAVSPKTVDVSDKNYQDITGGNLKTTLVKTHGSLMIIAWMLFSSIAILIPKYYKNTGPKTGICGKAFWFQVHRVLMIVSVLLTTIAFIIIFVEVGGYAYHLKGADAIHPIAGIIVASVVVLNPLLALFRPSVDAPNRPVFYAIHKTLGKFGHLIAAAAMFLGTRLDKANMPYISQWIVVGFAVWHFAVDHLLGLHQTGYNKTQLVISDYENLNSDDRLKEPEHEAEVTEDTKPLSGNSGLMAMKTAMAGRSASTFKFVVMMGHICVLLACSLTLILNLAQN